MCACKTKKASSATKLFWASNPSVRSKKSFEHSERILALPIQINPNLDRITATLAILLFATIPRWTSHAWHSHLLNRCHVETGQLAGAISTSRPISGNSCRTLLAPCTPPQPDHHWVVEQQLQIDIWARAIGEPSGWSTLLREPLHTS